MPDLPPLTSVHLPANQGLRLCCPTEMRLISTWTPREEQHFLGTKQPLKLTLLQPKTRHQSVPSREDGFKGETRGRRQGERPGSKQFHSLFEVLHATSAQESCTFRTGLTTRARGRTQTRAWNERTAGGAQAQELAGAAPGVPWCAGASPRATFPGHPLGAGHNPALPSQGIAVLLR